MTNMKHIIRIAFWTSALAVMFIVFAVAAFAQDAVLQVPAVQAQMAQLYKQAAGSYMTSDRIEYSFTVDITGQPRAITSSHDSMKNYVKFFVGDLAIIHTHPNGADPRPSDGDVVTAKKCGVPNYELSQSALWVAMPDGTSHKVGDVSLHHGVLEIK